MKTKLLYLFIYLILFYTINISSVLGLSSLTKNEEEIVKRCWQSVVKVEGISDKQCILGTGVAIANRTIVTNTHVTSGLSTVTIYWKDKKFTGLVLSENANLDISFVSIPINIPVIKINPSLPKIGNKVFALGYPKGFPTISVGEVIGAKFITDFMHIESDVIMTSGNSGGPLVNENGQLIGINRAIVVDDFYYRSGLSIPSAVVTNELKRMINLDKLPSTDERATLGILSKEVDSFQLYDGTIVKLPKGIYVEDIISSSFAYNSGLKKGDIIVKIDDTRINDLQTLLKILDYYKPGETIKLTVFRIISLENNTPQLKEYVFSMTLSHPTN